MLFQQQWKCVIWFCKLTDCLFCREDSIGNDFISQVSVNVCDLKVWKLICEGFYRNRISIGEF